MTSRRLLVIGLLVVALVSCGSDETSSSEDYAQTSEANRNREGLEYLDNGDAVGEYVVKYRGQDLHCLQGGHFGDSTNSYFVVCDFAKFYAEHPDFLPRSGK